METLIKNIIQKFCTFTNNKFIRTDLMIRTTHNVTTFKIISVYGLAVKSKSLFVTHSE